jgi:hypothetical protein
MDRFVGLVFLQICGFVGWVGSPVDVLSGGFYGFSNDVVC